ncbi:MAG: ATP-binding cassette domain-containing protein, partial [Planctomycetes bacterium]|nr:ATP-binding cassette domain-containing protein [Planctomycetota bacterium]
MIELHDVHKRLGTRDILKGLTLTVPKGMNFVLMGPSGTGKSVTLKHVIGIFKPDRGSVHVDGQDVPAMDHHQLMALRKRMGYLFQNGALINWLTVADNVALPLKEHSKLPRSEVEDRVHQVLGMVGMDHAAQQFPPSISGGMKLRTGLARAIVTKPEYVLYDEPNAGL